MTLVLDAYATIAVIAGEVAAPVIQREMRRAGADVCMSAVNLAEVVDQLVRVAGAAPDSVGRSLQMLEVAGLTVVPVDAQVGLAAGELRAKHYRRGVVDVSLADCVAVATSVTLAAALATADPALAAVARREGVRVLGLPDSRGRTP